MKKFEPIRQIILRPTWTQAEGFVLGVGAKMFTIAGPVIVYGLICWLQAVSFWLEKH